MLRERLIFLRKEKNLTQAELARILGMSRDTYAQYEIERRVPEHGTLNKIADYFNVSLDYLTGRSDYRRIITNENDLVKIIDISNDDTIKDFPLFFKGKELTLKQKKQFIHLIRALHDSQIIQQESE